MKKTNQYIKDLKNIKALPANILSASRILAPFIIIPLAYSGAIIETIIASTLFLLTDFADGKIARALNTETKLGERLDQISDKVCSIGLLLGLIPTIPVMALPLILETTISLINIKNIKNNIKSKSTQNGRIKMWPLSLSIITGYAAFLAPTPLLKTIFTTLTYINVGTAATFEIINIKEYSNMEKSTTEPKALEQQEQKEKKITKKEEKTLDNYITKCDSIEELKTLKEILEPQTPQIIKQKTKILKKEKRK